MGSHVNVSLTMEWNRLIVLYWLGAGLDLSKYRWLSESMGCNKLVPLTFVQSELLANHFVITSLSPVCLVSW